MKTNNQENYEYRHHTDYIFKNTIQKYANGVLKFLNIPYTIHNIILSEISDAGPTLHRLDFAGEAMKNNQEICIIIECQSKLPTDEDIKRFFQYVSSLRILKNKKVELYILCTKKAPYKKKEFKINDECVFTMNVISLKDINAEDIIKNIENKNEITDEDIAALQLIAYTNYEEPLADLLTKVTKIVLELNIDANEKEAILYIFNVLSTNMLNEKDKNKLMEETKMMLNPRDEYFKNEGIKQGKEQGKKEGKKEIIQKLYQEGMPLNKIPLNELTNLTGLTKEEILNTK